MIPATDLSAPLLEHLPAHLRRQRWSGAHDRAIDGVELVWQDVLRSDEPLLLWTLVRVRFADGGVQDYQLFIGARSADPTPDFLHGKQREHIATLDGTVVYDALVDPDLAIAVLHLVSPDTEVTVRRPIVLEHSNSSIVFDESSILKIFRRVEPGPNPDTEITRVLAERGYEHVLPPLAELRRDGTDLAVLREFLTGSTEGWHLAHTSVRDILASSLDPEEAGGDFAPDAHRLGAVLAELHLAMAAAWGAQSGDARRWSAEMLHGLGEVLGGPHVQLEDLARAEVEERFRALAALEDPGQEIRIHGDLHLSQVMKSDSGWKVLDFEGEPARRRDDRFTTSSPLRDLAGLLRSLHYAASTGLAEWGGNGERAALVDQWEERNRAALITAYFDTEGIDALLPADPTVRDAVLSAFELDKAVYEVGYELGHRPDQVAIPLAGIDRLLRPRAGA